MALHTGPRGQTGGHIGPTPDPFETTLGIYDESRKTVVAAKTKIAQFSNQQTLQVPVQLPAEPMTSPREFKQGKLPDRSTQGTTPTKQCPAVKDQEQANGPKEAAGDQRLREKAPFPDKTNLSNLHTHVQLPPEPMTSPRDNRPSKSSDRSAHGTTPSRQSKASKDREQASALEQAAQQLRKNREKRQNKNTTEEVKVAGTMASQGQ